MSNAAIDRDSGPIERMATSGLLHHLQSPRLIPACELPPGHRHEQIAPTLLLPCLQRLRQQIGIGMENRVQRTCLLLQAVCHTLGLIRLLEPLQKLAAVGGQSL